MSDNRKWGWLKTYEGQEFAPYTEASLVLDNTDQDLQTVLDDLNNKILQKPGLIKNSEIKSEVFNDIDNNKANGEYSHAEGSETQAIGQYSHTEGRGNIAEGISAHAEGFDTLAKGMASHSEGWGTSAFGGASHSEGLLTSAKGGSSHAEGNGSNSIGDESHAEGYGTSAQGKASHAEGSYRVESDKIYIKQDEEGKYFFYELVTEEKKELLVENTLLPNGIIDNDGKIGISMLMPNTKLYIYKISPNEKYRIIKSLKDDNVSTVADNDQTPYLSLGFYKEKTNQS